MKRSYLKEIRLSKKLTLKQLAEKMGVSRQTLGNIEKGRRDPSFALACKLQNYFEIDNCTLLKRDGDED